MTRGIDRRIGSMALFIGAGLIGGAGQGPGPVSRADTTAVQGVISQQLAAFRRNDADTAYRLASSDIEAKFGSPARFVAMVAAAYPAVYRAHAVSFGPIARYGDAMIQHVSLQGPDGARDVAVYALERQGGAWRIDGCVLAADTSEAI